jgi:hypothetical protein
MPPSICWMFNLLVDCLKGELKAKLPSNSPTLLSELLSSKLLWELFLNIWKAPCDLLRAKMSVFAEN